MPKTLPDVAFTAAVKRLVTEKHNGKYAPAASELGVPRQHMKRFFEGGVPMEPRKGKCLAVLKRAGYYPPAMVDGTPNSVILGTDSVTGWADKAGLANMLRFLADLIDQHQAAEIPVPPRDVEITR